MSRARTVLALALLPVGGCGFVDELARTSFQVPEARFRVVATADQPLTQVVEREREVQIAAADVGGSSNLDEVAVEDVDVVVYTTFRSVRIDGVSFIVEPLDPTTSTLFATLGPIEADVTDWGDPVVNEPGRTHLEGYIGSPQASFRLRAVLAFDLDEGQTVTSGTLDMRLRIHASALAAR